MCRKCGEADRRGSAASRRARKLRWLAEWGDGVTVPCAWAFPEVCTAPEGLSFAMITADRLDRGSTYRFENCVPACQACNYYRYLKNHEIPEGCDFGPVDEEAASA